MHLIRIVNKLNMYQHFFPTGPKNLGSMQVWAAIHDSENDMMAIGPRDAN